MEFEVRGVKQPHTKANGRLRVVGGEMREHAGQRHLRARATADCPRGSSIAATRGEIRTTPQSLSERGEEALLLSSGRVCGEEEIRGGESDTCASADAHNRGQRALCRRIGGDARNLRRHAACERTDAWRNCCLFFTCSLAVLSSSAALECYKSDVAYDGKTFRLEQTVMQFCPATTKHCVTRNYAGNFVAHECSKIFENCSVVGVPKPSVDVMGAHTYTCCNFDLCNDKDLRLPDRDYSAAVPVVRPRCEAWLPRDFDENTQNNFTRAKDLKQGFTKIRDDQRSGSTFGVQPPTAKRWLYSRDTSSPSCFWVAGEIKTGFCGKRFNVLQDGSKAKNAFGETDIVFEGKYFNQICGGSRSEALAMQDDFTLVNADVNRDKCMRLLLDSALRADCESIQGKYNVYELLQRRRAVLPDCCLTYGEMQMAQRNKCDCYDTLTVLSTECAAYKLLWYPRFEPDFPCPCCLPQCCFTRMMSQCHTESNCNDANLEVGRLDSLSSLPLCCDYCERYYDEICSYRKVDENGVMTGTMIRMTQQTLKDGLRDLCKRKLCRDVYPCTFNPTSSPASRGRDTSIHTVLVFVLISFILYIRA